MIDYKANLDSARLGMLREMVESDQTREFLISERDAALARMDAAKAQLADRDFQIGYLQAALADARRASQKGKCRGVNCPRVLRAEREQVRQMLRADTATGAAIILGFITVSALLGVAW